MKLGTVWMFSGQGAQYYQMGAPLYAQDSVFRATVDDCSRRLEPWLGESLRTLLYQPRPDRFATFDRTLHTHAALFTVQYALAQTLRHRGCRPDFLLGYSLGEFVACAVAECVTLDEALAAVVAHARALERHAPEGAMLAVVDRIGIVARFPTEFAAVEIAAENYDGHFAVAGPCAAIDTLHRTLRAAAINSAPLPVRFAFHSTQIQPAADAFLSFARTLPFRPPRIPVISSARAALMEQPGPDDLWRVTAQRVRCRETVEILETSGPHRYLDLGPSGTMANFVKYNERRDPRSQFHSIITPFQRDVEMLAAVETQLRPPPI